jgi:hypothetical protein
MSSALSMLVFSFEGIDCTTISNQYFITKNITEYTFYTRTTDRVALYTNSVVSWSGAGIGTVNSTAVTLTSGNVPRFYTDGLYFGPGHVALSIVGGSNAVQLGGGSGGTTPMLTSSNIYLIWQDTVLTDAEVAQAHQWCMSRKSLLERKSYWSGVDHSFVTGREEGCIAAWDLGDIRNGLVLDKSGNSFHGTVDGLIQSIASPVGNSAWFDGTSSIDVTGITSTVQSYSLVFIIQHVSTASTQWIFDSQSGRLLIRWYSGIRIVHAGGAGDIGATPPIRREPYHCVLTFDAVNSEIKCYLDGEKYGSTISYTGTNLGAATRIGSGYSGATSFFLGALKNLSITTNVWSAADVKNRYLQFAKLPTFIDTLADAPVSINDEGGGLGESLSSTSWNFGEASTSCRVVEDTIYGETHKSIIYNAGGAGVIYTENPQAYGTWEFDFRKDDASALYIAFVASISAPVTTTGQDGYFFLVSAVERIFLRRTTNGSAVDLFYSPISYVTPDTWYTIRVTRDSYGQFTCYIKGDTFTNWTLILTDSGTNPVSDTTHTTGKYLVIDGAAGDMIANFRAYQGVLDPT